MKLLKILMERRILFVVFFVIVSVLVFDFLKKLIDSKISELNQRDKNTKKHTNYLKMCKSIIKYAIILLDAIIILQAFGIDVSSIIASLGVISIVVGLAMQDALKDIIAGFNIIIDGYYSVGDIITLDDIEGKIEEIRLKITILKDIRTGDVLVVANRNILKALRSSDYFDINIPLPYEEKIKKAEKLIDEVMKYIKEDNKTIKKVAYLGIEEFADSAIKYRIRLWCNPEEKPQIRRNALRTIKFELDKQKITIPYMQVDLHQK